MISGSLIKIILPKSRKRMIGKPVEIIFGPFAEMTQTRLFTDFEIVSGVKGHKNLLKISKFVPEVAVI